MKSLATWCVRHRLVVVLLWVAALVGMTLLSQGVGTAYSNNFSLPHTESTEALDLLQAAAPKQAGDQERIVFHTTDGTPVTDPRSRPPSTTCSTKVAAIPHVTTCSRRSPRPRPPSPVPRRPDRHVVPGPHQVSADGQTAFVNVTFDVQSQNVDVAQAKDFVDAALTAQGPHLQVAVSGLIAEQADRQSARRHRTRRPPGRRRPAARLRLGLRHGAAAAVGAGLARHGHRGDRPAQPRPQDAGVLDRAGPADRPRRRRRLRPVHRDPAPPGAHGRQRRRVVHRQRRQHLGPGRAVRRDHRLHRPARACSPSA